MTHPSNTRRIRGVTLAELLVVLAAFGVVLALAGPALRDMLVRNRMSSLANEFVASYVQARHEAVTRNSCVTLCQSNDASNAFSGGPVSCSTAGPNDWLKGAIIVENRACDPAIGAVGGNDAPIIRIIPPAGDGYMLTSGAGAAPRRFMFDSRGLPGSGMASLQLTSSNADPATLAHRRQLCISQAGRVTVRKWVNGNCT